MTSMRPSKDHSFLAQIVIARASSLSPLAVDISAVFGGKVEVCTREEGGTRATRMAPREARRIAHALIVAADSAEFGQS